MMKKKIMCVDDDTEFLNYLSWYLKKTDRYEVRTISNGNEAVALALEFKPDLILCDVVMPIVDGGEVASQIRSNVELQDIPLVFLTTLVREQESATRKQYVDKYEFIQKLAKKEELINCIEGLMQRG